MTTYNYVTDDEYRARMAKLYRVDSSGCWLWTGRLQAWGYGFFSYRGENAAHRAMYRLTTGKPIPRKMRVCHTCDVRRCVNPDHLWLGTQQQNIQDCAKKGRHTNGAKKQCRRGHEYTPGSFRYTDAGKGRKRKQCIVCQRARLRINAGWPEQLAYSMPPQGHGYRPVKANWARVR
jgi:hypothetical protein